jgi:short-subunit dehydrogenase
MKIDSARVLLTGGAGGIGRAIAEEMLRLGAHVLLVDRDDRALREARLQLAPYAKRVGTLVGDLTSPPDRTRICEFAGIWHGGVDTLVNSAGLNPFGLFENQSERDIDLTFAVNVQAPLHLCREFLPYLKSRPRACIVNIGSVFGAIGYPGYAIYCASKFALRGLTEALRRELSGTNVTVHYLAPRATRTPINSSTVERMNAELGVAMDSPRRVADSVVRLVNARSASAVIGWPEKIFVRINALLPAVVDRAIRKQLPIIERYARPESTTTEKRKEAI